MRFSPMFTQYRSLSEWLHKCFRNRLHAHITYTVSLLQWKHEHFTTLYFLIYLVICHINWGWRWILSKPILYGARKSPNIRFPRNSPDVSADLSPILFWLREKRIKDRVPGVCLLPVSVTAGCQIWVSSYFCCYLSIILFIVGSNGCKENWNPCGV